ncbi:MAG TPA: HEAT repeat domain-containing protein [Thermoanaerobaculia bacterium]|nr:HEAT repeat domain-containing protein [Thermoanaerobaculia bacterium]
MTRATRSLLFLPFLLAAACGVIGLGPQSIPPEPLEGISIEEEALVLRLEDRREYDPIIAHTWMTDPSPFHRARMALALGRIGPHGFVDRNRNGERDPGELQAGVELLTRVVADSSIDVRRNAAFSLGEIGDSSAIDALFRFAADEHGDVAAEAVEALSKMAASVPFDRYQAIVRNEPREGVRSRAIRFLFRFNTDEASSIATALLGDSSTAIRQEAAYALSRRAHAPAAGPLALLLSDGTTLVRAYAARALGLIGEPRLVEPLVSSLLDPHPWVRTNAMRSIIQIAAKDPSAVRRLELPKDVIRVVALTDDPDPGSRATAVELLGFYAPLNSAARERLLEIAREGTRWQRELAAAAIALHLPLDDGSNLLASLLDDEEIGLIRAVLNASGTTPAGRTLRARFASHQNESVRAAAVGAVPDDSVDAEIELVRSALDDADPVVRANAIDRYAHQTVDPRETMIERLIAAEARAKHDRLNDGRLSAIAALAGIDRPEREEFLRALVQDRDPVVRRLGAELLRDSPGRNLPQYVPLPIDRSISEYITIAEWARSEHTAVIEMPRGRIEILLLPKDAPLTAWNFARLAQAGYFDNTSFMRVVPNFVIQGGDPRNDMTGGPGYSIRDEINLQKYTRGAVGMALSGADTGGSQFFITHSPQPHLDGGYTIFGRVVDGMGGVVDQVERGDRVSTITIDRIAPATAARVGEIQQTPRPMSTGEMTPAELIRILPIYAELRDRYQPDDAVIELLASSVHDGDRIEVVLGTWCDDSEREVPKLLRILDILGSDYEIDLPVRYLAVDRTKMAPAALIEGKRIEKVATFIYYRDGEEIGRIEETPAALFEDDLLRIAARR